MPASTLSDFSIAEECFNEKSFAHDALTDDGNYEFPWMAVYLTFLVLFHLMHTFV